jgi:hypothetical protein
MLLLLHERLPQVDRWNSIIREGLAARYLSLVDVRFSDDEVVMLRKHLADIALDVVENRIPGMKSNFDTENIWWRENASRLLQMLRDPSVLGDLGDNEQYASVMDK